MSAALTDFLVQTLSGVVGVFVGVWLALVVDRKQQARRDAAAEAERQQQSGRARHTVLGSVVKNANEAKRLRLRINHRKPQELLHSKLEASVWDAVRAEFMRACHDIDERVRFAQVFDGVRHLQAFLDFHRQLQISIAAAVDEEDPELAVILRDADQHLRELLEDQRLNGMLLITDFGEPVHRKLMGLKTASP